MADRGATVHGLLIVDKPEGIGSTDVLRVLERRLGQKGLGHGGTLDPFASGVLPVLCGHATRLLPYLQGQDKLYRATLRLGVATDTLDRTGRIVAERPVPAGFDAERVRTEVLGRFVGEVELPVPAFAAVRVEGERLYRKAFRGETVQRPLRRTTIHRLLLEEYGNPQEMTVLVHCGSGTYVRSLAEAIGEAMGTVAHLTVLRRLAVGPFCVEQAVPLSACDPGRVQAALIPPALALPWLAALTLDETEVSRVRQGKLLPPERVPEATGPGAILRLLDAQGRLAALGEVLPERRGVKVARGFPAEG